MDQTLYQERVPQAPSPSFAPLLSGNYTQNFIKAMGQAGVSFKENIIEDGTIHRFSTGNKSQKDGWYVFYGLAGAFGDWRQGLSKTWNLRNAPVPGLDKEQLFEQIKKVKETAEEERTRKQEESAIVALGEWNAASEAGNSPYLERKKVEPFGARFKGDQLIIPLRDTGGKLWSLQYISPDGAKRFLTGGRKKGCFHSIGQLEDGKPLIIVEGYATGASVHRATHHATVIAFDAGNLDPVIEELKKAYPKSPIVIAGDDDSWKEKNAGRTAAEEAAQKYDCSILFPTFKETETKPTDFNDLHGLEGIGEVKRQIDKVLHQTEWPEPTPISSIKNDLAPVVPLPPQLIPEPYQPWLVDIAERMQCPLDYVAVGSLIVTASLIGTGCSIKPKALDSWTVIPNLWGGVMGSPSTLKSPA
ncbi:MAG: toprim domain-containing protein, partial [Alphaproteobacteria bacterium]|nr:toprim domain-containing protein [Alphaproteobacteria bacterium]